ncbi:hypothetical protein GCM10007977_082620 [Dactylosporangium sucinum]|uniref:CoA-binding domain-containing protein n=1 Tax=Dactylosporangium sucinum TaxID=1424081 RepID=A0A917U9E9_9ACTN|nr:hypothetical protein GCM10007977_082620 [Dactylosporangium sucinum]
MRTAREILARARTIAVVGASRDPLKPAHWVPKTLQEQGWRIVPVNPFASEVLGERAYARLADIPEPVDVVNVFRPAREAPELVRQAAAAGARAVWLQPGIASAAARRLAHDAGLDYVEDCCIGAQRALAQMVAGGATPRPVVYRGLYPPQPQPDDRAPNQHFRIVVAGGTQRAVRLSAAAPWCVPSHRASCRSAPTTWTDGHVEARMRRVRSRRAGS